MNGLARTERDSEALRRRRNALAGVAAMAITVSLGAHALGQPCAPAWTNAGAELIPAAIPEPIVLGLAELDPDGPGPAMREFYMCGAFGFANNPNAANIARWDGFGWQDLGASFLSGHPNNIASEIRACIVGQDIDSAAPRQALYVVGGFNSVAGIPTRLVAKWDGAKWTGYPGLPSSGVIAWAVTIHDFDGNGPQQPQLIVGGPVGPGFAFAWDGASWRSLGASGSVAISGLVSFDSDGKGPAPPRLFAQVYEVGIVEWTGSGWTLRNAQAAGLNSGFAAIDSDGPGPADAELYVSGSPVFSLRNGSDWVAVSFSTTALRTFDPDGDGPLLPELYAISASGTTRELLRLNGSGWQQVQRISNCSGTVRTLSWFDEDGVGPREAGLFIGGDLRQVNGETMYGVARYGCAFEMPRCFGDANGSGLVEFDDVSLVLARWGSRDQPGDIDHDGVVGMNDVVAVLASWGSDCEALAARPSTVDAESAWRARGIEDFNGDGAVNMDDEIWAIANARLDARSPYGWMDQEQPMEAAVGRTPH